VSKIFYPTSERLSYLLESIHEREVALPNFQRDFVWDPAATEELLESVCQNFPAGSLLRIKNGAGFVFDPREFAGAPALDGHAPSYLILDGQQRLTSLYQALYGHGTHRYFFDISRFLADEDLEDCIFHLRTDRAEKRYGSIEKQAEALVFPLSGLLASKDGFEGWLDQVVDHRSDRDAKTLKASLREARSKWLRNLEDYEFPMVTLADDSSPEAVCTIFETLNRTGVKLSVFDLLAARFWTGVRLRDLWGEVKAKYPVVEEFDVAPYYLLQAIAIFTAKGAPSCKRGDVLRMEVSQIHEGWVPIADGFGSALGLLRDECGVQVQNWLPYATMLIPMAAVFASSKGLKGLKGLDEGAMRLKMKRWFWCAVLGQAFENAPNSQAIKEYAELQRWISGGQLPETVAHFVFEPAVLRQTTVRQRAIYSGVMALILRHGSLDFHSTNPMTAKMIHDEQIDDHHLFPQGWFKDHPEVDGALVDSVLNRTLIDQVTNIRIGKRAPSDYLGEVREKLGDVTLRAILKSHLVPSDDEGPLFRDDFSGFLREREALVAAQIDLVTS
jgi:hypothetical protein